MMTNRTQKDLFFICTKKVVSAILIAAFLTTTIPQGIAQNASRSVLAPESAFKQLEREKQHRTAELESQKPDTQCTLFRVIKPEACAAVPVKETMPDPLGDPSHIFERLPHSTSTVNQDTKDFMTYFYNGVSAAVRENFAGAYDFPQYYKQLCEFSPAKIAERKIQLKNLLGELKQTRLLIAEKYELVLGKYGGDRAYVDGIINNFDIMTAGLEKVISGETKTGIGAYDLSLVVESGVERFIAEATALAALAQSGQPVPLERVQAACAMSPFLYLTPDQKQQLTGLKSTINKIKKSAPSLQGMLPVIKEYLATEWVDRKETEQNITAAFTMSIDARPHERTPYRLTLLILDRSPRLFMSQMSGTDMVIGINRAVFDIKNTGVRQALTDMGIYYELCKMLQKKNEKDLDDFEGLLMMSVRSLRSNLGGENILPAEFGAILKNARIIDDVTIDLFLSMIWARNISYSYMIDDRVVIKELSERHRRYVKNADFQSAFDQIAKAVEEKNREEGKAIQDRKERNAQREMILKALDRYFFAKPVPVTAHIAALPPAEISPAADQRQVGVPAAVKQKPEAVVEQPKELLYLSVAKPDAYAVRPMRAGAPVVLSNPVSLSERLPHVDIEISPDTIPFVSFFIKLRSIMKDDLYRAIDIEQVFKQLLRYSPAFVAKNKGQLQALSGEISDFLKAVRRKPDNLYNRYPSDMMTNQALEKLETFAQNVEGVAKGRIPTGADREIMEIRIDNGLEPVLAGIDAALTVADREKHVDAAALQELCRPIRCVAMTPAQVKKIKALRSKTAEAKKRYPEFGAVNEYLSRLHAQALLDMSDFSDAIMNTMAMCFAEMPAGTVRYNLAVVLLDESPRIFMSNAAGNNFAIGINRVVFDIPDAAVRAVFVKMGVLHELSRLIKGGNELDAVFINDQSKFDDKYVELLLREKGVSAEHYYQTMRASGVTDMASVEFILGDVLCDRYMDSVESGNTARMATITALFAQFTVEDFKEIFRLFQDYARQIEKMDTADGPAGAFDAENEMQDDHEYNTHMRRMMVNDLNRKGIEAIERIFIGRARVSPAVTAITPAALPAPVSVAVEEKAAPAETAEPVIDPVLEHCKKLSDTLKEYEDVLRLLLRRPVAGELTIHKIVSKPQKGSPQIVVQITAESALPSEGQYLMMKTKVFKVGAVNADKREIELFKVDAEGAQIKEQIVLRFGLKDEDVQPIERQIKLIQVIRQKLKYKTSGNEMLDRLFGISGLPVLSGSQAKEVPAADRMFTLSDSQVVALYTSLGRSEIVYIDGTYKTGKTMTLAEIMYQSVIANKKVLFISPVSPDNDPSVKEVKRFLGEDHFYEYPRIYKGEQGCVESITVQDFVSRAGKGIGSYDVVIADDCPRDVMIESFNYLTAGGKTIFARSEKGAPLFGMNADELAYLTDTGNKKYAPSFIDEQGDHVSLSEKMHLAPVLAALSEVIAGHSDGIGITPDQVKSFQLRVGKVSGDDTVNTFLKEIIKQLREYRDKGIPASDVTIVVPDRLQAAYIDGLLRIQHLRNFLGIKDDALMPRITTCDDGMRAQNKAVIIALVFCPPREAIEFINKHGRLLAAESLTLLYDPAGVTGDAEKLFYQRITDYYARVIPTPRKQADLPNDVARVVTERTLKPGALLIEPGSRTFSPVALKLSEGMPKPFVFVTRTLPEGKPEYIITAEVSDEKSLAVKWGDELEELVKSMSISSKEIQDVVQSVILMTGGDEHKIPKSLNLAFLDQSSHLAEYFPRTHTVGLNRAFEGMSARGRKALFMASLFDILSQLLTPETPPAGSLARLGSFLSDIMRDNKISLEELTREVKAGLNPEKASQLIDAVHREEGKIVRLPERQKLEIVPAARRYDKIFKSYLDECVRVKLISAVQRSKIEEIVLADNPESGWDREGIKQLVKFTNNPHLRRFSTITDAHNKPLEYLPKTELDLVRIFKRVKNIGGVMKRIPFDEFSADTAVIKDPETERMVKEGALLANSQMQGVLTELYHVLCLKRAEGKPVSEFSMPLEVKGVQETEVDTILSPEEGIVESKSRFRFQFREGIGRYEDLDDIISHKLQQLQGVVARKDFANLSSKKITFTFNRRLLELAVSKIVDKMRVENPVADISIDFENILPHRELGDDLETGIMREWRKEKVQTLTVNAADLITCIKNRYAHHPSGWEIDIKIFQDVLFWRKNVPEREKEAGKERILAADRAMQKVLTDYNKRIADLFKLSESQIGTLPETLEYDEEKIGAAVDKYGVSILTVHAKGKEIEEAAKWLAQRDLLTTDGYLRVVQDIQEALQPFTLTMGWKDYWSDPRQNPKRKLVEYITTAKPALMDILQMLRNVRDAVSAVSDKKRLTSQIEFICDRDIDTPLVKKMEGSKQIVQLNIPQILGKEDLVASLLVPPTSIAKADYMEVKAPYYSKESYWKDTDSTPIKIVTPEDGLKYVENPVKVPVTVSGGDIEVIVEKEMLDTLPALTAEMLGQLLKEALDRSGGSLDRLPRNAQDKPFFVLATLAKSSHMLEDHIANGFIGINRALFGITDDKIRGILLQLGVFHELCHEVTGKLPAQELVHFEEMQIMRDARYAYRLISVIGLQPAALKPVLLEHLQPAVVRFMDLLDLLQSLRTELKSKRTAYAFDMKDPDTKLALSEKIYMTLRERFNLNTAEPKQRARLLAVTLQIVRMGDGGWQTAQNVVNYMEEGLGFDVKSKRMKFGVKSKLLTPVYGIAQGAPATLEYWKLFLERLRVRFGIASYAGIENKERQKIATAAFYTAMGKKLPGEKINEKERRFNALIEEVKVRFGITEEDLSRDVRAGGIELKEKVRFITAAYAVALAEDGLGTFKGTIKEIGAIFGISNAEMYKKEEAGGLALSEKIRLVTAAYAVVLAKDGLATFKDTIKEIGAIFGISRRELFKKEADGGLELSEKIRLMTAAYNVALAEDGLDRFKAAMSEIENIIGISAAEMGKKETAGGLELGEKIRLITAAYNVALADDGLDRFKSAMREIESVMGITAAEMMKKEADGGLEFGEKIRLITAAYEVALVEDGLDRFKAAITEIERIIGITPAAMVKKETEGGLDVGEKIRLMTAAYNVTETKDGLETFKATLAEIERIFGISAAEMAKTDAEGGFPLSEKIRLMTAAYAVAKAKDGLESFYHLIDTYKRRKGLNDDLLKTVTRKEKIAVISDIYSQTVKVGIGRVAKAEYMEVKAPYYRVQSVRNGKTVSFANADESKRFGENMIVAGKAVKEHVTVEGRTFELIIEKGIGLTAEAVKAQMSEALARTRGIGGDISKFPQTLVFALLDQSSHMFEDHIANGFIGINRALFEIRDDKIRGLLLQVGVFHELCHEVTGTLLPAQLAKFEIAQMGRDAQYTSTLMQKMGVTFADFKALLERYFAPAIDAFIQEVANAFVMKLAVKGKTSRGGSFWQRAKDFGLLKLASLCVIPAVGIIYYLSIQEMSHITVPVKSEKEIAVPVPISAPELPEKLPEQAQHKLLQKVPTEMDRLTADQFIQDVAVPREVRYFNEVRLPGSMSWDHVQLLVDDEYGQPNRQPAELRSSIGKVSDYTAASKESVHIAYLLNLITGKPALKKVQLTADDKEQQELTAMDLAATTENIAKLRLFEKLKTHRNYGTLMPWVSVNQNGTLKATTDFIPALDNGQTTWSLLAVIGALQGKNDPFSADIVKLAEEVLKLHNYAPFLNKTTGLLHAEVNNDLSERGGYELNDMYEGAMAVLYAVLTGQVPESAWDNIGIETVEYKTQDGETIDVLKGYRGSMHELWALGWIPFMESPLAPVLKNFAYAHMDIARKNALPGVGATCYTSKGYQQVGPFVLASHPGDREDVATAYATAMLMLVDRDAGLSWFRNLYGYPGMAGTYGIIESVNPSGYANVLSTDSKGLVLLSLCGGLNGEVKAYLKTHTVPGTKQSMYDKLMELLSRKQRQLMEQRKGMPLRTAARQYPQPSDKYFGVTLTAAVVPPEYDVINVLKFEHHHGLHVAENWRNPKGGITISYRIPGDDPDKFAWKGTFVPPVNISKMRYVSVTIPADTSRYIFNIELKDSIRDFILAHAIVDTTAAEDVMMSPDGKLKMIVCRIHPVSASKLNEFDYFSVSIDDPVFKNMPDVGKFDIRDVKLTQANPITGMIPEPISEKIQIPGENDIFPYITWPNGGLAIKKDKERETVVFTDRLSGEGKWKGGFISPPLDLGAKYSGGHINLVVKNLMQSVSVFEFEIKNDRRNLLGDKYRVMLSVNPDWQVIQVPIPAQKEMIANYIAISEVAGMFEFAAITFDTTPAGPPSVIGPVKAEYMQIKDPKFYDPQSAKISADGKRTPVEFETPDGVYAFGTGMPHVPVAVTIDGKVIEAIVEKELYDTMPDMADILDKTLKEAILRSGGSIGNLPMNAQGKPFLALAILDKSSHMVEDHIANGFIGINRMLFDIKDDKMRKMLMQVGLFHEMCHEVTGDQGKAFEKVQIERDAEYGCGLLQDAGIGMKILEPVLREHFAAPIVGFVNALKAKALTLGIELKEMSPLYMPIETPHRSISDESVSAAVVGSQA